MKFISYDKAKWHYGAKTFPADLPIENGGTHIAFFLRWCIEKDFICKDILDDNPTEIQQIKNGKLDCRHFFFNWMDGVFSSEELNAKGAKFANVYYSNDKTKFAKTYGYYLTDYNNWLESHRDLTEKYGYNAYFYVENTNDNYSSIKTIIDNRYNEFLDMTKK
jgi:hypothetical protein